ncbi:glutamine-rich protein 2-like isoform X8 [Bolinopsis microptera]|uniref:glutamine-rich protein 2-like isoform X8 n=1 Tax=Bolinopsis microptera TaxID=2820187 RepID=UPI00307AD539
MLGPRENHGIQLNEDLVMGTKVELHQFIDLSVDIHEQKSTVNFVYLNRVLHELVKHLGIGNLEILIEDGNDRPPSPKQTVSLPNVALTTEPDSKPVESTMSVLSDSDNQVISDLKDKVDGLEKKISVMDGLVPDETKMQHTESMIGDMWNFVNLGKRVDGCEDTLETHAKLIDGIRKEIKDLNSYKFYLDQLKENSTIDLRAMIDGLISDMGEKTKKINGLTDKIRALENSKPDEALAQELAKKVEGLIKLKDEIDGKMAGLPTRADITNIQENYVSWIGLDEILRNYKPPRTPAPPSREGIAALQKADELDQKTDDLGDKISGLEKEVIGKLDKDEFAARIEDAIKQRPPSSRTEQARKHFTEALQDLQDRIAALEAEFGGKALPDDLKSQLELLQNGVNNALKAAELIGEISQENETNKAAISELNGQIEDIMDRYKILQDSIDNSPKPTAELDSEALNTLKDTIKALKDEQEHHHDQLNKLSDNATQNDLHLKTLYSGVDDLREMKADKDFVVLEMEDKADKRVVDHKANRVFVDNHFEKLNSGLESALQRCEGQEAALKHAITQISNDVEGKLDRMELQNVKDFLENRLNKLKAPGPPQPPTNEVDMDAAGMRRRLLKFHCISCDRPVEVNSGNMLPSTLPVSYGFPGMRSNRPYTTYELELIRQHQRNQNIPRYPWSDPYDMPQTNRSCGGMHTMTYAHRRTRISALSQFFKDDEPPPVPVPLRETELQGQDGHIYRGRLERKFPVLPRVGQSAEKLPRIMSPRRRTVM